MSGEIWFYHLERSTIEGALPPLVEKCLGRGWRALVRGEIAERLDALDAALWTYRDDSFLAHARHGRDDPSRHPVLLSGQGGNPNAAAALVAVDGADTSDAKDFERVIILFDGRDETALKAARERWKTAKQAGLAVSYWKETPQGRWEKQN